MESPKNSTQIALQHISWWNRLQYTMWIYDVTSHFYYIALKNWWYAFRPSFIDYTNGLHENTVYSDGFVRGYVCDHFLEC